MRFSYLKRVGGILLFSVLISCSSSPPYRTIRANRPKPNMDRIWGRMPNENLDKMAKQGCEDDSTQLLGSAQTAHAKRTFTSKTSTTSYNSYKIGCYSCILFVVLIQLVDCRHHDLKNVITSSTPYSYFTPPTSPPPTRPSSS